MSQNDKSGIGAKFLKMMARAVWTAIKANPKGALLAGAAETVAGGFDLAGEAGRHLKAILDVEMPNRAKAVRALHAASAFDPDSARNLALDEVFVVFGEGGLDLSILGEFDAAAIKHRIGRYFGHVPTHLTNRTSATFASAAKHRTEPVNLVTGAERLADLFPVGLDFAGDGRRLPRCNASLQHYIASGTFADVWLCQLENGTNVIAKIFKAICESELPGHEAAVYRKLHRDGRCYQAAALLHDNLAPEPAPHWLLFDHQPGAMSLRAWIDAYGHRVPVLAAIEMVRRIARACHEVHSRGVVHCDLKPENILVTTRGLPLLVDFGVSRRAFVQGGTGTTVLGFGKVLGGSMGFMSREQKRGDDATPDFDVFALGVILLQLLTSDPTEDASGNFHGSIPKDVPKDLIAVIDTALSPRGQRYATALLFEEALGETTSARLLWLRLQLGRTDAAIRSRAGHFVATISEFLFSYQENMIAVTAAGFLAVVAAVLAFVGVNSLDKWADCHEAQQVCAGSSWASMSGCREQLRRLQAHECPGLGPEALNKVLRRICAAGGGGNECEQFEPTTLVFRSAAAPSSKRTVNAVVPATPDANDSTTAAGIGVALLSDQGRQPLLPEPTPQALPLRNGQNQASPGLRFGPQDDGRRARMGVGPELPPVSNKLSERIESNRLAGQHVPNRPGSAAGSSSLPMPDAVAEPVHTVPVAAPSFAEPPAIQPEDSTVALKVSACGNDCRPHDCVSGYCTRMEADFCASNTVSGDDAIVNVLHVKPNALLSAIWTFSYKFDHGTSIPDDAELVFAIGGKSKRLTIGAEAAAGQLRGPYKLAIDDVATGLGKLIVSARCDGCWVDGKSTGLRATGGQLELRIRDR